MPKALSVGVPWELFWHLNPKKLQAFNEAHKLQIEEIDAMVHSWVGAYGISAITTSIAKCFSKNSKAEYIEKPIMADLTTEETKVRNAPLTEEEKRKQTEQLFMRLKIMGSNHKRNHKDSTVS